MIDYKVRTPRLQELLCVGPFHEWMLSNGTRCTTFYRVDEAYLLRFQDLADFQVSADGLNVTCFPAPHVPDTMTEHLYLNEVLPLALSRREPLGKLVFHGSAVEVAGGAVAFLADSGQGKSTLAGSFGTGGYRFLADDRLALDPVDGGYNVLPSHPSIRLWEDSRQVLVDENAETAPPFHFTPKPKFRFLAGTQLVHCNQPLPLLRAYFLGDGSAQEITFRRLSGAESVLAWVKHSFLLDAEDRTMLSPHFDWVTKLANQLPCYNLDYPRRFEDLYRVREAIVEHETAESSIS